MSSWEIRNIRHYENWVSSIAKNNPGQVWPGILFVLLNYFLRPKSVVLYMKN
jgi:hypothetical protein